MEFSLEFISFIWYFPIHRNNYEEIEFFLLYLYSATMMRIMEFILGCAMLYFLRCGIVYYARSLQIFQTSIGLNNIISQKLLHSCMVK
jgi:hypothetical protein